MAITFDPNKRDWTLRHRKLDFRDASKVFASDMRVSVIDERRVYGELRYITAGYLDGRMVIFAWTPRGFDQHVFSMRHCHADEEALWRKRIEKAVARRSPDHG
jgi:uncharacterized protein